MFAIRPGPSEATLHGSFRRRVWAFPEVQSHSFVVLTNATIYLTPQAGEPRPDVVAAVEAGADLESRLGPLATGIDYATIRGVTLDLLANTLVLHIAAPGHDPRQLDVVFASQSAADACFAKLWRRLGDGFVLEPYRRDTWSLIRGPLVLLGVILTVTLALALVSHAFEEGAEARAAGMLASRPPSALESLFATLTWQIICGIGGAFAAAIQIRVYRRLTEPPVKLVLTRTL